MLQFIAEDNGLSFKLVRTINC